MFEAEADGLRELRSANAIRVPEILACGVENGQSFLELERFSFDRPRTETETQFGNRMADLHRHTKDRFGWFRDNTIGPTPQINDWSDDWIAFFRTHRLEYQVRLAVANGFGADLELAGRQLADKLPDLFMGYEPVASLLHGDLWSGNWGSVDDEPVIFDPAVYYGPSNDFMRGQWRDDIPFESRDSDFNFHTILRGLSFEYNFQYFYILWLFHH